MMVVTWETARHQAAIAGRLTNAQTGKGVGGALVQIASGPPEFTQAVVLRSKQYGAQWATMLERLDQTHTAADGHFHFMDLPDGPYRVTAALPGAGTRYGTAEVELPVSRDGDGNLALARAGITLRPTTIAGRVTDGSSEPVVMAEVRVKGGEKTYTDGGGHFLLAGVETGSRTVLVSARGLLSASAAVVLGEPGAEAALDFELSSKAFKPTEIDGCELWLKAEAIAGLGDGDPVAAWPDGSGKAHDATQGTEGDRPTYRAVAIGGKPAVGFDGVDDYMALAVAGPSNDHTFFFVYDQTPQGGHSNYLFEAQAGRLTLDSASASAPYGVRWNDGAWERVADAVPGKQLLTWVFSGTTGEVFRNGASLGTATYSPKPESTEGGRRVSVLRRQEGAPVLLG